jgi:hypothetical protein
MEQKQEQDLRTQALKDELFQKYGGNSEMSMVDMYLQSQSKARYVTTGIQRFESNLIQSLQRI